MSTQPPPDPFVEPYPGFSNEDQGPLILGVTTALTGLAFLLVLGRIYSRLLSLGRLATDDYIVIFSIILALTYLGIVGVSVHFGGGRHMATLDPWQASMVVKLTVISFVPGVLSFVFPKFAVLVLLVKLLNPSRIHIACMWAMAVIYLVLISCMLAINFVQCSPVAAQWGEAEGTCWDRNIINNYALAMSILSVLFDFYLAMYPTVILWRLRMDWKKKLALSVSLGFGYCAGGVTVYKCTTFAGLIYLHDFTYALGNVVLWTSIEANCVLIGACIPTLFPLVKKLFGSTALGGSKPINASSGRNGSNSNPLATVGSYPKGKKKNRRSLSQFDTIPEDDSKYIILEERTLSFSTAELRPGDEADSERIRGTRQEGW